MVFKCSIPGCKNTSNTARTHCLPRDSDIRRKWCEAVHRMDLVDVDSSKERHKFRVCDIHFSDEFKFAVDKNRTNLKFNAVPTLYLGASSTEKTALVVESKELGTSTEETVAETRPRIATPLPSTSSDLPASPRTPPHSEGSLLKKKLLRSVGVTRAIHLTPKARKLYSYAKDLKKITRRLDVENASNKQRLTEALSHANSTEFLKAKVSQRTLNFINCQIKMLEKKSRGRRFNFEDKVFALSLLKQGPRAYNILRKTFALPSRKTLMNILNKIHFTTGLVPKVMDTLKQSVKKMDSLDKHCALIFDEIFLEPGLTYDKKWDSVVGFQDIDGERSLRFADHALVFMVQGLRKKWKQPISFHFSEGGMNADQLKCLIRDTILALQNIGFVIVCTVCDQYSANCNAIKKLREDSAHVCASDIDIFKIEEQEIIAIYDPPHLLKGIRNNFIEHDILFVLNNVKQHATWDHITQLYRLDEGDFNTRMCYKLTDAHVYKEKLKKMKVKHAAQVFSHRVSSTMRWTVKYGQEGILPKSAEQTANFLSFMDNVFDSVNGSNQDADHGKELRCAIKPDSPHIQFWEKSIEVFNSIKFLTPKGEKTPPSVKNWVKTLRGFIYIWRKLSNIGFKYLCLRRINQDSLENFFGCIRSHGARNVNPTCYSFISSFKALIINNFTSPHSSNANCEADDNDILDSLRSLLTFENNPEILSAEKDDTEMNDVVQFQNVENNKIIATHSYIAGYIAKNIKKKIGTCSICIKSVASIIFFSRPFSN